MGAPKTLVVVESPAKAKTIKKYLGADYEVLASYGHVRDLVAKEGAVDPAQGFAMRYEPIERNVRHVDAIARALRKADRLLLATDPDREGEAIAWHLSELLRERAVLNGKPVGRVVFHEVTQPAVRAAIEHPGELATALVNAQQARRALDYLVGFGLSPLLWRKIRPGLSAGRVQSPALRLIVEREEQIEAFQAQEYWTIEARARQGQSAFAARLVQYLGQKVEQFTFTDAAGAHGARDAIARAAGGELRVLTVTRKARQRHPAPPFITSTLQQEASRRFGFTAQRTMRIAQQLYEGVDVGNGPTGLITYMRTDSVNLSAEALGEMRGLIAKEYGDEYLPERPRAFRTRAKNAQEAHEAIRPTSAWRRPSELAQGLTAEQLKLYTLIWQRALASQMSAARLDTVAADLGAGDAAVLRANGSTLVFKGFLVLYDDRESGEDGDSALPPLTEDATVALDDVVADQHFTEPPPRYTEASLIKALEEFGIGRPSTYAAIISTLQQREYVRMEQKRFRSTDVGRVVSRFLTEHFATYVDYDFTARLEDDLDAVSRGERDWVPLLEGFWQPFQARISDTAASVARRDVVAQTLDEACPECGKPLVQRLGRRGTFIGCSGYPECRYTRDVADVRPDGADANAPAPEPTPVDHPCPRCGGELAIRRGRFGAFIGCRNYPACKHIEPLQKPRDTGVICPECRAHPLVEKRSRRGGTFYSCEGYPACKYAVWNQPVAAPCPSCGHAILTRKISKREGPRLVCPRKECGYTAPDAPSSE
jgi:DNA topoisomerase I